MCGVFIIFEVLDLEFTLDQPIRSRKQKSNEVYINECVAYVDQTALHLRLLNYRSLCIRRKGVRTFGKSANKYVITLGIGMALQHYLIILSARYVTGNFENIW